MEDIKVNEGVINAVEEVATKTSNKGVLGMGIAVAATVVVSAGVFLYKKFKPKKEEEEVTRHYVETVDNDVDDMDEDK